MSLTDRQYCGCTTVVRTRRGGSACGGIHRISAVCTRTDSESLRTERGRSTTTPTGAALGDVQSQLRLAALDLESPVSLARTESALRWLRVAAEQDHPQGHNGWRGCSQLPDTISCAMAPLPSPRRTAPSPLHESASTLDTLAAAYAESGDFERAVATQRDAIAALGKDEQRLRKAFEQHLDHYLKREPWRE